MSGGAEVWNVLVLETAFCTIATVRRSVARSPATFHCMADRRLLMACACGGLILLFAFFRSSPAATQPTINKKLVTVSTPLGEMQCTSIGPEDAPHLAVAIHGMSPGLVMEWEGVAMAIAAQPGWRVLLPNFHTLPKKLRDLTHAEFSSIALELIRLQGRAKADLWLGKSWGGEMSANFAAEHPANVAKLVLDAPVVQPSAIPSLCASGRLKGMPLLLLWAEDDQVSDASAAETWKSSCSPLAHVFTTKQGGHRILTDAYTAPILGLMAARLGMGAARSLYV